MTPLRQRLLEDMRLHNFSPETQRSYVQSYFNQIPEELNVDAIRECQLYLAPHPPARHLRLHHEYKRERRPQNPRMHRRQNRLSP
jgi:hypothetical protein